VVSTRPLGRLGIECETADSATRAALDKAIIRVMEGCGTELTSKRVRGTSSVSDLCTSPGPPNDPKGERRRHFDAR
jgi:hypothetical protein